MKDGMCDTNSVHFLNTTFKHPVSVTSSYLSQAFGPFDSDKVTCHNLKLYALIIIFNPLIQSNLFPRCRIYVETMRSYLNSKVLMHMQ